MKNKIPPRILFIGNYPFDAQGSVTGPERVTYNIVNGVYASGQYSVALVLPHRIRRFFSKTTLISEKNKPPVYKVHLLRFFFFVKKYQPDIIHVSGILYLGLLSVLVKFINKKIKIIYTAHGLLSRESKYGLKPTFLEKVSERMLLKKSAVMTTVSEITKKMIIKDYAVSGSKIFVIPNGFDASLYNYSIGKNFFKNKFDIQGGKIILFVGRLHRVKGIGFLLDAMLGLKVEDYKLVFVGNRSDYWEQIIKQYPEKLLNKLIRIDNLPQIELANAYAACDIFILPSEYEPFGLVALEAMAFGKPVIVTDRVGMGSFIKNSVDGFVVKFNDKDELATVIEGLLSNRDKQKQIGKNALIASRQLTYEKLVNKFINLYESVKEDS